MREEFEKETGLIKPVYENYATIDEYRIAKYHWWEQYAIWWEKRNEWVSVEERLPDFRDNVKYDVWHKQKGRLIDCEFFMPNQNLDDAYFRTQISNVVLSLNFITYWRYSPTPPDEATRRRG